MFPNEIHYCPSGKEWAPLVVLWGWCGAGPSCATLSDPSFASKCPSWALGLNRDPYSCGDLPAFGHLGFQSSSRFSSPLCVLTFKLVIHETLMGVKVSSRHKSPHCLLMLMFFSSLLMLHTY